jgi:hypothetical protein
VNGGTLTCASFVPGPTTSGCVDPRINGNEIADTESDADAVCSSLTANDASSMSSAAAAGAVQMSWNGSAWQAASSPNKLVNVLCTH